MPNVFTPDNPNGNNRFGSVSRKTLYQEMLIYNRRGELVFRCNEPDCSWDGRDLNGNPCVQDAYVYIIRYTNEFEPNNTKVIKGTVTLLR
jgi:gliding motility-associated-like protein